MLVQLCDSLLRLYSLLQGPAFTSKSGIALRLSHWNYWLFGFSAGLKMVLLWMQAEEAIEKPVYCLLLGHIS